MTAEEFIKGLPKQVRTEALEGVDTLFHFDLEGDGGGQFSVEARDGKIQVVDGLSGDPKCTVKASSENFVNVVTGKLNPMVALMMGKIKISNQSELLKYAKLFGLM